MNKLEIKDPRRYFLALLVAVVAGTVLSYYVWNRSDSYQIKSSSLPIEKVWEFATSEPILNAFLSSKNVYLVSRRGIYAIDRTTGEQSWKINRNKVIDVVPPTVPDSNIVVVATNDGKFIEAVSNTTGMSIWQVSVDKIVGNPDALARTINVSTEQVFVGTALFRGTKIFALRMTDGVETWDSPQEIQESYPSNAYLYGDWLAVKGIDIWYLGRENGEIVNKDSLPETNRFAFASSHIYAITDGIGIKALAPLTTAEQWLFRVQCDTAGYWILALPKSPDNETIVEASCSTGVFTSERSIYNLNDNTGEPIWTHKLKPAVFPKSFTNMGNYIFYIIEDGSVYALDRSDGEPAGEMHFVPATVQTPNVDARILSDNEMLLYLPGDNQVFAFESK
jgi:outer membrane protein assembly factor BamB